jgi:hypothetical protein
VLRVIEELCRGMRRSNSYLCVSPESDRTTYDSGLITMVRCYCDVVYVTGVNAGVHETPQLAGYEKE